MQPIANIDFETRSTVDLKTRGAHLYAAHESTDVMCMSWRLTGMDAQLWEPGQRMPGVLCQHIANGGEMHAWNAAFERLIWPIMANRYGAPPVDPLQWRCTMVKALLLGFPASLDAAGPAMGLPFSKDKEGHALMMRVSKPRDIAYEGSSGKYKEYVDEALACFGSPLPEYTITTDQIDRPCVARWWVDAPRRVRLGEYCLVDNDVEHAAGEFLDDIPPLEQEAYQMDQRINDRGVYIDKVLVEKALQLKGPATDEANTELKALTRRLDGSSELTSINQVAQLKNWLNGRLGLELESIDKDTLGVVKHEIDLDDTTRDVIDLRLEAAKTSTAKLNAMLAGIDSENIFRGGLQFAGAGRTNRWAGRRLQLHNFPRPPKWALDAVEVVLRQDTRSSKLLFGRMLGVISAILRSCITARPGHELTVADYNAIEARIVAWLANSEKLLDAYRTGKDPYRMMAAAVFGIVNWEDIDKESFERWLGKKIILGCGFGMGDKRFWGSCREEGVFIERTLAKTSIDTYRADNPEIPAAWRALENAAIYAMHYPGQWVSCLEGKIWFYKDKNYLRMRLPSGRTLSYFKAEVRPDMTPWGKPCWKLWFWGWNGQKNRMEWQNLYGGRIMENAAQAIARDIMMSAMLQLDKDGWDITLTVHDELITDQPKGERSLQSLITTMVLAPKAWAPDLPLAAEGWQGHRYRK